MNRIKSSGLSHRILFGIKLDINTDTQHEMMIRNAPQHKLTKVYLAIHQVSLTGILKVLWTCSVYRLDFVVFICVIEPMCLRPYPVYIKMCAKAKKVV